VGSVGKKYRRGMTTVRAILSDRTGIWKKGDKGKKKEGKGLRYETNHSQLNFNVLLN
jgi:hypothetical protein